MAVKVLIEHRNFEQLFCTTIKNFSRQMRQPYVCVANESNQSDYKQLRLIFRPLTNQLLDWCWIQEWPNYHIVVNYCSVFFPLFSARFRINCCETNNEPYLQSNFDSHSCDIRKSRATSCAKSRVNRLHLSLYSYLWYRTLSFSILIMNGKNS